MREGDKVAPADSLWSPWRACGVGGGAAGGGGSRGGGALCSPTSSTVKTSVAQPMLAFHSASHAHARQLRGRRCSTPSSRLPMLIPATVPHAHTGSWRGSRGVLAPSGRRHEARMRTPRHAGLGCAGSSGARRTVVADGVQALTDLLDRHDRGGLGPVLKTPPWEVRPQGPPPAPTPVSGKAQGRPEVLTAQERRTAWEACPGHGGALSNIAFDFSIGGASCR